MSGSNQPTLAHFQNELVTVLSVYRVYRNIFALGLELGNIA
jgi:hypothetical protein